MRIIILVHLIALLVSLEGCELCREIRKPNISLPQSGIDKQAQKPSAIVAPLPMASAESIATIEKQDNINIDKKERQREFIESDRWKSLSEEEVYRIARQNDIYPVYISINNNIPDYSKFIGISMPSIGRLFNQYNHRYGADHNQKIALANAVDTPTPKIQELDESTLNIKEIGFLVHTTHYRRE